MVDDTIVQKPHMDENELISWHYDHTEDQTVEGVNLLSVLYVVLGVSLPVSFRIVKKTENYLDKKTGTQKRKSPVSKNEMYREMLCQCVNNQIPFRYVMNDVWFTSSENMRFIKLDLGKQFLMPTKTNRKVAFSEEERTAKQFQRVDMVALEENQGRIVYLEDVPFPRLLCKQVFPNKDGICGILYLLSSEMTNEAATLLDLDQTRWQVKVHHKSIKQNASLGKSPAHTVRMQANPLFASLCAYMKLEVMKVKSAWNHFALKQKLYLEALRAVFALLRAQPDHFSFAA